MTPEEIYKQDLERPGFEPDPCQAAAVSALQVVFNDLTARVDCDVEAPGSKSYMGQVGDSLRALFGQKKIIKQVPVTGLYLWGGVGRGKTYLMDLFYEALPFDKKVRIHFHRFMRRAHNELKLLQGEKNPLQIVADRLAEKTRIICFDEFFVSDITDAMILGGLFEALFERGVSLVATSNIPPDELYKDGLQRARFLPAIKLINEYTRVMKLDSDVDYRLRALERAEIYHAPLDQESEENLERYFEQLAPGHVERDSAIEVEGRMIPVRRAADDLLWVNFDHLCGGPRSQNDYIEIARMYHAVLISGIPQFKAGDDDRAKRFIYLVDEFYDRNVKLIVSAEVEIQALYGGERLKFEFQRTESRLLEMQSHEYLERPHQP